MVKIDDVLLERLQKLSMLQIEDEKKSAIEEDLNKFLAFVDVLEELDLSSCEATFSPTTTQAPLRKDEPHLDPTISKQILEHAPKAQDDFFIVPKIIE